MAETQVERKIEDIFLRLNSTDTKIKINEQNLLNLQSRVQLLSKNLLDLKKEVRDQVDSITRKNSKMERLVNDLKKKVERFERKGISELISKGEEIKKPSEMTKEEAEKVLDNILKMMEEK